MIILSIDPAKLTGLALWDTDSPNVPKTAAIEVRNSYDASGALLHLQNFTRGTRPDYAIIERPFFRDGRSINAFHSHVALFSYWKTALYGRWGFRPHLHDKRMTSKSKSREIWPATWQSKMLESKGKGRTKEEARDLALKKWPNLSKTLSWDEYDACCIALYQWVMCRDLGVKDPVRSRLFEKMRQGGWLVPTPEEMELFHE